LPLHRLCTIRCLVLFNLSLAASFFASKSRLYITYQAFGGRTWSHQHFCVLCGYNECRETKLLAEEGARLKKAEKKETIAKIGRLKGKAKAAAQTAAAIQTKADAEEEARAAVPRQFMKCAHCPFIFHPSCAEEYEVT
jgi:hypothetical protein